jgi:hypothetical protein
MGVDKLDFAPRVGFAYQYRPDIVVRGGFGITYGSLGNIGAAPYVLGNNYPFVYSAQQSANGSSTIPIQVAGLTPQPTSGSTLTPTIENAFTSTNISSPANASIKGIQVAGMGTGDNYQTPYMESYNLTVQKQLGSHDSVQLAYVGDIGQHLDSRGTNNQPSIFLPSGTGQAAYSPFPDLALESAWLSTNGHSMYNSMQAVYNHEVSLGLNLTANYTWSKCMTDAADISERLPPRAQFLPGFGIASEYSTCIDNANQTFHASGSYDLPFGTGKQFLSSASHAENLIIGGWALNGIFAYQTGQPFTIPSANNVPSGMSADANIVGNQYEGAKTPSAWLIPNPTPHHFGWRDRSGLRPSWSEADAERWTYFLQHRFVHLQELRDQGRFDLPAVPGGAVQSSEPWAIQQPVFAAELQEQWFRCVIVGKERKPHYAALSEAVLLAFG